MTVQPSFDASKLTICEGLARAYDEAWSRMAAPGTWLSGAERIAIAREARMARTCPLCDARAAAVTPYAVAGEHAAVAPLSREVVEISHRLATDAGRVTQRWLDEVLHAGVTVEVYVEAIGIIASLTAIDEFDRALGRELRILPASATGGPTRKRPTMAQLTDAWVPTVAPGSYQPGEIDPYPLHGSKNIHRALSLVPQEVINFFDLDVELYLRDQEIREFGVEHRALTHPQIELMAARASALNDCYY